jgi:protein SCO1/2
MKIFLSSFLLGLVALQPLSSLAHDDATGGVDPAKAAPAVFSPGEEPPRTPDEAILKRVDFQQKLDAQLPVNMTFTDDRGQTAPLKHFIGDKAAVFVLAYTHCKTLCSLVLKGMTHALQQARLEPGVDYNVVILSIDPKEIPSEAHEKKLAYVQEYSSTIKNGGAPASISDVSDKGWYFLSTTDDSAIHKIADTVGFKYTYVPQSHEYAHPSGIMVVTPEGKVSRYFMGVNFPVRDLRLSLVDASSGKIGTLTDQLVLFCYHYDPQLGRYSFAINNALKIFGILFLIALAAGVGRLLWIERRNSPRKRILDSKAEHLGGSL